MSFHEIYEQKLTLLLELYNFSHSVHCECFGKNIIRR